MFRGTLKPRVLLEATPPPALPCPVLATESSLIALVLMTVNVPGWIVELELPMPQLSDDVALRRHTTWLATLSVDCPFRIRGAALQRWVSRVYLWLLADLIVLHTHNDAIPSKFTRQWSSVSGFR